MLFNEGKTIDAEHQYTNAIGCLKQLQMKVYLCSPLIIQLFIQLFYWTYIIKGVGGPGLKGHVGLKKSIFPPVSMVLEK